MLTAAEQKEIVKLAMRLVSYRQRLKDAVPKLMDKRRAKELWERKLDDFRDHLKEVGDVPLPRVPVTKGNVDFSDQAQAKDRSPGL